ncbi:hypothetical protein [Janthinobacterium sp. GW458P]|uniref:hypothetical protein n=1 Tax=Janthinobacterium sp. GW458P TaxID=1981504 RepID=UPI0011205F8C|nr:hypothetical protein [Janthinobacterium sp. GW458P]
MYIVTPLFFVAGAALLIFGFRKNDRKLLAFAACLWLVCGAWDEFSEGFIDGVNASAPAVSSSPAP